MSPHQDHATPADVVSSSDISSLPTKTSTTDKELLEKWMKHTDLSFHTFEDATAVQIRSNLLDWYRGHRRKLPWRGDPPPYDGSTAGVNNVNAKKVSKPSSQKITSFFAPTKASKSKSSNNDSATDEPHKTMEAIPVSGYGVWVSEIMLQQTRVEAVIPYWCRWMQAFPTVHDLAAATEDQVNAHWAGLGFYRRARLLHQGAKHIVKEYQGQMPTTVEGLLQISGIGPYTASAIASIAFDVCVPVVDGNVCRVLSRLTGIANHIKSPALKDKHGWDLAKQLVEAGDGKHAGEVNQALMELGATYCAPSGTGIDPRDPLRGFYMSTRLGNAWARAYRSGDPLALQTIDDCSCPMCDSGGIQTVLEEWKARIADEITEEDCLKLGHAVFPLDPPKTKKREEDLSVAAIANTFQGETWWLLIKRPKTGLLAGQWEFPATCVQIRKASDDKPPSAKTRTKALDTFLKELQTQIDAGDTQNQLSQLTRTLAKPAPLEHIFSHIKHIMWVESATLSEDLQVLEWKTPEGRDVRWMRESDMKEVGITSGVKKILKAVKAEQSPSKKRKR